MVIVSAGIMRFNYGWGFDFLARTLEHMRNVDYDGNALWEAAEQKMAKNRKRVFIHSGQGHYQHKAGIED